MASDKFFSDDYLDQLNPQKQAEQGPGRFSDSHSRTMKNVVSISAKSCAVVCLSFAR